MFVTIVIAALVVDGALRPGRPDPGHAPVARPTSSARSSSTTSWSSTCSALAIFAALFYLTVRRGATDPVCGMKVDRDQGAPRGARRAHLLLLLGRLPLRSSRPIPAGTRERSARRPRRTPRDTPTDGSRGMPHSVAAIARTFERGAWATSPRRARDSLLAYFFGFLLGAISPDPGPAGTPARSSRPRVASEITNAGARAPCPLSRGATCRRFASRPSPGSMTRWSGRPPGGALQGAADRAGGTGSRPARPRSRLRHRHTRDPGEAARAACRDGWP